MLKSIFLRASSTYYFNLLIIIGSRYDRYKKMFWSGEKDNIELNEINLSILELVDSYCQDEINHTQ